MSSDRKEAMITVRLDRDLKAKMDEREEINWSGVVRKAIRTTVEDIEQMDEIAHRNQMTEEDAQELADRITEAADKRETSVHEEDDSKSGVATQ